MISISHLNQINIVEKVFNENINYENACLLLKNWDKIKMTLNPDRVYKILNPKNGLDPLKVIKKIVKQRLTELQSYYKYSTKLQDSGRLYAVGGVLQAMPREFRGLIQNNQYDVDIVNCHPIILSQFCSKNNIDCPHLKEYANNRDFHLERIANDLRCSKKEVKEIFLSVLNGGIRDGISDDFFKNFKTECYDIHHQIKNLYPERYNKIKSRKDFNASGSLTNVILCEIENQLLIHAINFLSNEGYEITTLVFDGFMVSKDKILDDDMLSQLSNYIKEKSSYDVDYIIKDFDSTIDLSIYQDNINESAPNQDELMSYSEFKEYFELTHCKIIHPAMILSFVNGEYKLKSLKQACDSYQHLYYLGKDKKGEPCEKSFIHDWLCDRHIRVYNEIEFSPPPLISRPNNFNSWIDFKIKEVPLIQTERDYWNEYLNYIHKLIPNEAEANFILSRYAFKLQNPGLRTHVCVIYYGKEGCGKNCLLDPIYKIFDCYAVSLDNAKKLYETHSTYEKEKLLVRIDEAAGLSNFENSETLKTRITESKLAVNPKGIQAYSIDLLCDYDMTTNNLNVVKFTDDSTRRFFQIETSDYYQGNSEFFSDYIKNIMNNSTALRQIYEGFMSFDVNSIIPSGNFQKDKPITKIEMEVRQANRDRILNFLNDLANETYDEEDELLSYTSQEFFDKYLYWCSRCNIKNENITKLAFGRKINQLAKDKLNKDYLFTLTQDTHNKRFISVKHLKEFFEKLNYGFIED